MAQAYFSRKIALLWILFIALDLWMLLFAPPGILDARFYYDSTEATRFLSGLTAAKADAYLLNEKIDLLLIATYSSLLFLSLKYFFPLKRGRTIISLLPGFFDLIETLTILSVLSTDGRIAAFPGLGYVTSAKWVSAAVATGFFAFGIFLRNRKGLV